MAAADLTIDLNALIVNWRALDALSGPGVQTGACVKADAYGLGTERAVRALAKAGAKRFFVALAEEGAAIRAAAGPDVQICVFSGHMRGDTDMIRDLHLTPMLNSLNQVTRHFETMPTHPFGIQLDTGMNRLGMEPGEWAGLAPILLQQNPVLVMSHLACADEPEHVMNASQLAQFQEMTDGIGAPRSLAATGGVLMGREYHFDVTRPGIGLYGGLPFAAGEQVVQLSLPVIQIRDVTAGESVGYGNTWIAKRNSRIATVSGGYADGLIRAMGSGAIVMYAGDTPCPIVGRVSMDLITVDITDAQGAPTALELLNTHQTIEDLAAAAGTIGYEILTSLGARYSRRYVGG